MADPVKYPNAIVLNPGQEGLDELKEEVERILVTKTLLETGGNISQAARLLKISRPRLYDLMSQYGLGRSKSIVSLPQPRSDKTRK